MAVLKLMNVEHEALENKYKHHLIFAEYYLTSLFFKL